VTILSEADLNAFLAAHKDAVVAFSQKWCGHCKTLKVPFDAAARRSAIPCAYVDAATFTPASLDRFSLKGFPHIVRVTNGKSKIFSGPRTEESFMSFAA
jgi:thioredoxin-like negative regulator of GroEL